MFLKPFLFFSFACSHFLLATSDWYEQKLEGWYYFQEQEEMEVSEKSPTLENAEEVLEGAKAELKKLLSLALLVPTLENVENYIQEQRRWVNQSSLFADAWGKILLEKPFLGDFLIHPTTNYGLLAKREIDLSKRKALLQELSKTHFLLFFFHGKDPLSDKAAEIANLFSSMNQWKVKAISLDGYGISGISNFEIDNGIGEKLGVEAAPSFFIINPFENKIFPVGAGLISVSDLEQNIEIQVLNEMGHE